MDATRGCRRWLCHRVRNRARTHLGATIDSRLKMDFRPSVRGARTVRFSLKKHGSRPQQPWERRHTPEPPPRSKHQPTTPNTTGARGQILVTPVDHGHNPQHHGGANRAVILRNARFAPPRESGGREPCVSP